ncbi:MAG: hypothetical protein HC842_02255 [Cytophagales bacterium]|nr:hypothetical protein [Cytophagales bacterium]
MGFADEVNKYKQDVNAKVETRSDEKYEIEYEPKQNERKDGDPPRGVAHGDSFEDVDTRQEQTIETKEEEKKYRVGKMVFSSEEEAESYVENLKLKAAKYEGHNEAIEKLLGKKESATEEIKPSISDRFYSNPDEVLTEIEEKAVLRATRAIEEKREKEDAKTKLWSDFYTKNPDLKNFSDEVDLIMRAKWEDLKDLPLSESLPKLAKETRRIIDKAANKGVTTEVIKKYNSPTLGSSFGVTQKAEAKEPEPVDFFNQIKQYQRR